MIKAGFVMFGLNIFASASSYLITIYLMRVLELSDFGYYSHVLLVSSLMSILIIYGTDQTAASEFFQKNSDKNKNKSIFSDIFFFRLTVLIIGGVLVKYLYSNEFLIGYLAFCIPSLTFSHIYEIKNRNINYSLIFFFERFAYTITAVIVFYFFSQNLIVLFLILLIVGLLSLAFQSYNLRFVPEISSLYNGYFLGYFKSNFFIVISILSLYVYGGISRIVLESKTDYESLALYSAAWQIVMLGTLFQTQIERIFRPIFAKFTLGIDSLGMLLKRYILNATLPILLLSLLFFTFGTDIITLAAGDKYKKIDGLIKIMSVYFIVISLDSFLRMFFIAQKTYKVYTIINLFFSVVLFAVIMMNDFERIEYFSFVVCIFHFFAVICSSFYFINFVWVKNNEA